jgi:hypothetical protein
MTDDPLPVPLQLMTIALLSVASWALLAWVLL